MLDFGEYERWRSAPGGGAKRAVVSEDQAVALVCLHGACPRR